MAHQKANQGHNTQITSILQTSVLKHPSKVTTLKLLQVSKLECFKTAHQCCNVWWALSIVRSVGSAWNVWCDLCWAGLKHSSLETWSNFSVIPLVGSLVGCFKTL